MNVASDEIAARCVSDGARRYEPQRHGAADTAFKPTTWPQKARGAQYTLASGCAPNSLHRVIDAVGENHVVTPARRPQIRFAKNRTQRTIPRMSTVEEIKAAIGQLPLEKRAALIAELCGWADDDRDWQMKADAAAGKLSAMNEAAAQAINEPIDNLTRYRTVSDAFESLKSDAKRRPRE